MAVVELKSTQITNDDATPSVLSDAILTGSRLIETIGHVQSNSDDSDNSEYLMVKVPSNARISEVLLSHDDSGSTGTANVGVFNADGTTKDEDLFGSAVDINTTAGSHVDVTFESGEYTIAESVKPLWDVLGESEDPFVYYIVGIKLTAAVTAATDFMLKVRYVI